MLAQQRLVAALYFFFAALALGSVTSTGQTPAGSGWPEYGGVSAQRYSSESQINGGNVEQLEVAWTFHTHALDKPSARSNWRASFEATPVLWKNTLYFDTPFDAIFAVDAATGKLKWTFDPQVDRSKEIYVVTSRGVALWHATKPKRGTCGSDVVLVATEDRRLMARDANTGAACVKFGVGGTVDLSQGVEIAQKDFYSFTSPPTVVGDTVVLGSLVADNMDAFIASGAVRGFDAVSGRQKWSWDPVRWTGNQHPKRTGSGNAWSIISADPEHDLVFVPTGSASVDFYGGERVGDNRDADSLVALRASTGERVWGFQLVHHDLWDYDTPSEPVLFTFRNSVPAVAVTTKSNMVFVFNRLTGEPLYPIVEKAVPASDIPGEKAWPTQPFSSLPPLGPLSFTAADVHLHDPADQKYCEDVLSRVVNKGIFTPPSGRGTLVYPGDIGGSNWGSSAFDPTSGVLYTRVSSAPFLVREISEDRSFSAILGRKWDLLLHGKPVDLPNGLSSPDSGDGRMIDSNPQEGTPFRLLRGGLVAPSGAPCGPQPFGSIVALNLNTGHKLWSVPSGEMSAGNSGSIGVGGVIVTAGGLVFGASSNDASISAYDTVTGKHLWRGTLPAPGEATPMTYSVGGRQYVVIAAGGHGFVAKGKSDAVVAFALPAQGRHARN